MHILIFPSKIWAKKWTLYMAKIWYFLTNVEVTVPGAEYWLCLKHLSL